MSIEKNRGWHSYLIAAMRLLRSALLRVASVLALFAASAAASAASSACCSRATSASSAAAVAAWPAVRAMYCCSAASRSAAELAQEVVAWLEKAGKIPTLASPR